VTHLRTVCIYAGSAPGARPAYRAETVVLTRLLVAQDVGIVYGGGRVGLMGALADAARGDGGRVTGIMPRQLAARELAHTGLDDLRIVGSMHERKALMADLSDAFIAAPGGIGTLEELVEVFTWNQLGLHRKPVALLDVDGYYRPLVAFFDHAVEEGFLREESRATLLVDDDPAGLIEKLRAWEPPAAGEQWIDRAAS
jgi:uncharacterized protein (TIGR00730 family)